MHITRMLLLQLTTITSVNCTLQTKKIDLRAQQKTVFVFDLHDVVLKKQYSIACKMFLKHLHWIRYNWMLITRLITFGYNKKIHTTDPKKLCVEHAIIKDIDDEQFKTYALTILNPHTPSHQTVQFVKELGEQGFMRFAFSNIGEKSFKHIHNGTDTIDHLFNGKYICNAQDGYITKASPKAFKQLLLHIIIPTYQAQYGKEQLPKEIIVVDDSRKKLKIMAKSLQELKKEHPTLCDISLKPLLFKNTMQMQEDIVKLLK